MKTLRKIGMAFLAVVLCVSFAACSDEDDGELFSKGPKIKSIEIETPNSGITSLDFIYNDRGLLTSVVEGYGNKIYTTSYTWNADNTISISTDDTDNYGVVYLDASSRIRDFKEKYSSNSISYDNQGHVSDVKFNDEGYLSYFTLKWQEGNCVMSQYQRNSHVEDQHFTYDETMDESGLAYLFDGHIYSSMFSGNDLQYLLVAHPFLLGVPSKNALIKARDNYGTYDYSYDKKSHPNKVVENFGNQKHIYNISWM